MNLVASTRSRVGRLGILAMSVSDGWMDGWMVRLS